MNRQVISKLADVDPAFVQMVKSLYGPDTDPREMWDIVKAMPDNSALHIPGNSKKSKKQLSPEAKKERNKKIGLAGGLVGGAAIETVAAKDTIKPLVSDIKAGKVRAKEVKGVANKVKAYKPLGPGIKPTRLGTGTKAGLMVGNLAVGLAAARELTKPKKSVKKNEEIIKIKLPVGPAAKLRRVNEAEKIALARVNERANNQKAAVKGQKVLGALALGGGAAGGYAGGKKYGLKLQKPVTAATVPPQSKKIGKSADMDFTWEGEISKVDVDKRLVFGWCSLSKMNGEHVVDLQGDYIPIEETENSAYRYVIESRKGGDMHRRVSKLDSDEPFHTADLVESVVFTPEKLEKMGLAPDALPHGWWIGMKVNDDDQWNAVKNKERLGFSIHGKGRRVEKSL